jgi:hypothetical protein
MLVDAVVRILDCYDLSFGEGFQDVATPLGCGVRREIGNITTNYAMVYFPNLNCIKHIPSPKQKILQQRVLILI